MASGQTLLIFHPWADEPPASSFPTKDTRNNHPVLDFDAAAVEATQWTGVMPANYTGGGLTVKVRFSATGITSGNVVWDVSFERIGTSVQDIDSDNFASAQSVTQAVAATDGYVAEGSIPFTNGAQMASVAAGETFRIKVSRNATSGSDTAAADAELVTLVILET